MKSLRPILLFSLSFTGRALSLHAGGPRAIHHVAARPVATSRAYFPTSARTRRCHALGVGRPFGEEDHDDECELIEMGYRPREVRSLPCPNPVLSAEEVVKLCMTHLLSNDDPRQNAGLEVCFVFSSDRCRAAQGGTLEAFIEHANNPTFGSMVDAREWSTANVGSIIAGTATRGAMQTVLVDVKPGDGARDRRFLWTLQQERRPPMQGCWLVHECLFVEAAIHQTL